MTNKKGSDGRYRYRVCIGKDESGKPKYKSFYGTTAREARAAAEAYRAALGKGMDPAQAKATLATLYDNLIAAKKAKGIVFSLPVSDVAGLAAPEPELKA